VTSISVDVQHRSIATGVFAFRRRNALTGLLLGIVLLTSPLVLRAAVPFVSDDGRFIIDFPVEAMQESDSTQTAIGPVVVHRVSAELADSVFMVGYNDYPAGTVTRDNVEGFYSNVIDGVVESIRSKNRGTVRYGAGSVDSREAIIDVPGKSLVARERCFILGNRPYQVLYLGSTGSEGSAEALSFLDSFRLLR